MKKYTATEDASPARSAPTAPAAPHRAAAAPGGPLRAIRFAVSTEERAQDPESYAAVR
ncbi:hypothetical protein OG730_28755 [Streptomyces sp. NBC_01298]|uniref:hypothetical protein n=1 Tax=Streptomyces sp. NBC_01298 TaxID=2903817 RepID=UPI002E0E56DE|nr:hypothetical protein OG730_28755 [Streptomyces sp. NBC_01298]